MRTRGRNLLLMLTFSSSPLFAVQFPPAQGKAPGIGQPAQSPSIPRTAQGQQTHVDKGGPAEEIVSLIQSSRPLDAAIRELRWFGIPISYEEPVWQSRDDIVPQGPVSGNPNRDPEVLVPARAALLLRFQVDAATRTHLREPMATILNELVSRHQSAANPGEFRVIDLGAQGYSIVPIRVKDSSGAMASAGSPLEVPISIEARERTFEETLDAFVKAVSQVSGRRIVFFDTIGSRLLAENHTEPLYTFGADKEVARSVLGRLLSQAFEQKMAWRLVHQPGKPGEAPISERVPGTRGSDPPKLLTGSTTAVQLLPRGGVTQRPVEDYYGLSFAPVVQQVDRSQLKADGSGRVVRPILWPNWDRAGSIK